MLPTAQQATAAASSPAQQIASLLKTTLKNTAMCHVTDHSAAHATQGHFKCVQLVILIDDAKSANFSGMAFVQIGS